MLPTSCTKTNPISIRPPEAVHLGSIQWIGCWGWCFYVHIHVTRFMWQNGLLCAHYVDKKWAVWRLFWTNFAVVGAMKFPFCVERCFAQIWRRNAIWGVPGRLLGLLRFFLLCRSSIQGVSHFLPQAGGFYVGLRGCFQERLLCVFT